LKYNNGTHDVTLLMAAKGGGLYSGVISDVTSGSLSFYIEAMDTPANIAIRASFTITWTPPGTTTTTESTTTTSTPPPLDMVLVVGIVGAIVLVLLIVVLVLKKR
jgi:hypothetical protein